MRASLIVTILTVLITSPVGAAEVGFQGAGGFSIAVYQPDLGPVNTELKALGVPEFTRTMILYGGQGFAHVSYHLRVGGMGFGGSTRVQDYEDGHAREATFSMTWGGVLIEYWFLEALNCEFYGGGTLGWGNASLQLEKTASPINWDAVWNNYQPETGASENISSQFTHSFFLAQPRLGVRYFPLNWLALGASVELPLVKLNSGGWKLNGNDVYGAPELNLIKPFFHFSVMIGG